MVKPNVYFSFAYTQKRDIKLFFRGRKRRRLFGVLFFSSSDKQFNICLCVCAKLKYEVSSGGGHEGTR